MAGFESLPRLDLGRARREERLGILGRSRRQIAALAALLIGGPCLLVPSTQQILEMRAQTAQSARQVAAVNAQWQRVSQTDGQADARISVWTRYQQSRDSRRVWNDALPTLAAALPAEVALQRAQITKDTDSAQFAAQGTAETMGALRLFLGRLTASPLFANIRLDETTTDTSAGPHDVAFKISGSLTTP